jgi:hypothetical protein
MKKQRTKSELLKFMQAKLIKKDMVNRMLGSQAEVFEEGAEVYLNVPKAINKPWVTTQEYKDFCESLRGKLVKTKPHFMLPNQYYLDGNETHVFHIADLEVSLDATGN